MDDVPGRDNLQGDLRDLSFDQEANDFKTEEPLNTAFYNRRYKVLGYGALILLR